MAPDFEQARPSEEQIGKMHYTIPHLHACPVFVIMTSEFSFLTRVEELHGKLDEERFLFSQENESAACDVLDLTEVISVFDCSAG